MKEFRFKKIDAFAENNSRGNPAGCIRLETFVDISEEEMQQIAKELQGFVSEVGFVSQTEPDQYKLRFFSSEREVDFCGHAAIAIMHDFLRNKNLWNIKELSISTHRGELTVLNRIREEDSVYIRAPEPVWAEKTISRDEVSGYLRVSAEGLDENTAIINAGLTTLLVPVKKLEDLLHIKPDILQLKEFTLKKGIDIIEVFTSETTSENSDYRVRVFAPKFGYLEDPATGSGNSAFGYYLLKNKLWDGLQPLSLEQNSDKINFNVVKLMTQKDSKNNLKVFFGGKGILRIDGKYILYP